MFQCDQLIYIQLQKTACTHIASQLAETFGGEQVGKHNPATAEQLKSNAYFVSSIRNPWDWYLSLWTFGVQGRGDLMRRLTKKHYARVLKSAVANPKANYGGLFYELNKDTGFWQSLYDCSDNPASFRKWLRLIHDPSQSRFLGEGYADTGLAGLCGFMTHRYLQLCCRDSAYLGSRRSIADYADLVRFEREHCYIDFFVRQESLEDDLCAAIEKVRPLTLAEEERIRAAKKTNTSKRSLSISDYYDGETLGLVSERDRLLIEKFGYSPPRLSAKEAKLVETGDPGGLGRKAFG